MRKLWNQNKEAKALIISTILTILGFGGAAFLFWFHRYDIPFAILLGGGIVAVVWLFLYFIKRTNKPHIKLEIALIFVRLILIVSLAVLFAILSYGFSIVVVSPIALIVSYFVVSIATLLIFIRKGE